jgi:F-type H+-transporting ATPase subunit epsilon
VVSPQETIFEGKIQSLIVPAETGKLGVLGDHAPLMAKLVPGKIQYRDDAKDFKEIPTKTGGFMEVNGNVVTILVDEI